MDSIDTIAKEIIAEDVEPEKPTLDMMLDNAISLISDIKAQIEKINTANKIEEDVEEHEVETETVEKDNAEEGEEA